MIKLSKILEDGLINLDNSFETMKANRDLVVDENSNLNVMTDEIYSRFQICKKAFEIVIKNLEKEERNVLLFM